MKQHMKRLGLFFGLFLVAIWNPSTTKDLAGAT
jgi:hypothetical protein